ncbi:MAG: MoaD/ThiS family protein [Pirellulales bacterium]|jgi:sulfur-carrier protein
MATLYFPSVFRTLAGVAGRIEVEGRTLGEVIEALDRVQPGVASRLRQGEALSPGMAAAVDGLLATGGLGTPVGPASEVHFLPAFGGG